MHWREWTKEEWEENKKRRLGGPGLQNCEWLEHPDILIENIRMANRENEIFGRKDYRIPGLTRFYRRLSEKCGVSPFEVLRKHGLSKEEWKACCDSQNTFQPAIEKKLTIPRSNVRPMDKEKKEE